MHLLAADYVATELGINHRSRMLLGSIAPDAASDKRAAHFKAAAHLYALNPPLDVGRFVVKYRDRFQDAFFVGYLTHLVMDDVWTMKTDFSGFEARVKENPQLYQLYHGDLRLCNAKLDKYYQPRNLYSELQAASDVPVLDEVHANAVLAYKGEALADFDYPAEHLSTPLRLFSFEEMVHYVERSKSKALDMCRMVV